jgi:hypothetical protein
LLAEFASFQALLGREPPKMVALLSVEKGLMPHDDPDALAEVAIVKRLADVCIEAGLLGLVAVGRGRAGGHGDDREPRTWRIMAETLDEFVPIQLGHREVGEDEVWRLGLNLIERLGPIGRRPHAGAEVFEKKPRGIQYELVIVNDEDREPIHEW